MKKLFISLTLVLALMLSMGISAFAADNVEAGEKITLGSGEKVDVNQGEITNNGGTVTLNYGVVHNFSGGKVDSNESNGLVYNYGGYVDTNQFSGVVYNFGGEVYDNYGKVYNAGGNSSNTGGKTYEYYSLTFTGDTDKLDLPIAEEALYDNFMKDHNGQYWVRENSGVFTFKVDAGYSITVNDACKSETDASGKVTISEVTKAVEINVAPIPAAPATSSVPATGDMSNMSLWGLLFIGFAAVAVLTGKKKA